MLGIIYSLLAGILISLQGVFNTRVSEKVGLWETTAIVHIVGFVFAVVMTFILGEGSLKGLGSVHKVYLLGGAFGVMIVFSVMRGISMLGAALSTSILIVTQLIVATIIDTLGLFGNSPIKFDFTKPLGILVMVIGIIIFKCRG